MSFRIEKFCIRCGDRYDSCSYFHCQPCRNFKNLVQMFAVNLVQSAVVRGHLPSLDGSIPCVDCGKPAKEYDHRDYLKPLKVEPTCRMCNRLRGTAKTIPASMTFEVYKEKAKRSVKRFIGRLKHENGNGTKRTRKADPRPRSK